jgi:hypothetical protein
LKQGKFDRGSLVAGYRMRGTYQWLRGKSKAAHRFWRRSLELAEALGTPYDLGMTHLEMGKWMGNSAHLKQAESIFAEMDAKFDLAQARKLLQGDSAS